MTQRILFVAAYDVRDERRLRHALRVLKDYATGGQKSVFECWLSARERGELYHRVRAVLDSGEDRFTLIRLEPRGKTRTLGTAQAPRDRGYFYLG